MFLFLIGSTYGLYFGAKVMPVAMVPLYALAGFGAGASVLALIIIAFLHRYGSAGSHFATTSATRFSAD
jgi:hypothetical protein